jgi:hypothetical protein
MNPIKKIIILFPDYLERQFVLTLLLDDKFRTI